MNRYQLIQATYQVTKQLGDIILTDPDMTNLIKNISIERPFFHIDDLFVINEKIIQDQLFKYYQYRPQLVGKWPADIIALHTAFTKKVIEKMQAAGKFKEIGQAVIYRHEKFIDLLTDLLNKKIVKWHDPKQQSTKLKIELENKTLNYWIVKD